jgi:hypothetical protein
MLAKRRIYEHAPSTISIPPEFQNASIEVLFLRINESGMGKNPETDDAYNQMKRILSSAPAKLSALSLDTTGFKFDREEANAR